MTHKTKHNLLSKLLWVMCVICGAGFYGFIWQSTQLTCQRPDLYEPINCTGNAKAFWLIPLKTKVVHNVQGAQLIESIDDEGDAVYRIELLTDQGPVPLTALFSSGATLKLEVIGKINTFVHNKNETKLIITEPGHLSRENIFWILLPMILLLLSAIWDECKSLQRRSQHGTDAKFTTGKGS